VVASGTRTWRQAKTTAQSEDGEQSDLRRSERIAENQKNITKINKRSQEGFQHDTNLKTRFLAKPREIERF